MLLKIYILPKKMNINAEKNSILHAIDPAIFQKTN